MPLPINSRVRCYISLDRARQFQATDREKNTKISHFRALPTSPVYPHCKFIDNLMEHVKV